MVTHKRGHLGKGRVLGDHVRPDVRVPAHDLPLLFGKRSGVVEDVVTNADLAEVVQRCSRSNEFDFPVTQLQPLA